MFIRARSGVVGFFRVHSDVPWWRRVSLGSFGRPLGVAWFIPARPACLLAHSGADWGSWGSFAFVGFIRARRCVNSGAPWGPFGFIGACPRG